MDKKRILFVDDDQNVLSGLRRMLHGMKDQWKMEFVTKPEDALEVMDCNPYDIIISDYQMPGMNGAELLEKVREKHPQMIRFMLSSYSDRLLHGRAFNCVHQFIPKPCQADKLKSMVSRAFALHSRIRSKEVGAVLSSLRSIPVMPKSFNEVLELINDDNASARQIGKVIASDIGMATKMLQLVNSSFAGQATKIADPIHAVSFLGLKTTQAILLSQGIFSQLPESIIQEFYIDGLQEHCTRVGALSMSIAKSQGLSNDDIDAATTAGILHDAGKIILMMKFPDEFREAIDQSRLLQKPLCQMEKELIGVSHDEIGGCLLDLWGLPNSIIEVATFHHEPWMHFHENFTVVSAVYLANVIDHHLCCGLGEGCSYPVNTDYLERLGVTEKWPEFCWLHLPFKIEEYQNV
jgi:putative nucleotidyltransferase with HDIG domain